MAKVQAEVNEKTYSFLKNSRKRVRILYGSAGSGKSWSIAQYLLLEKFYGEHDIGILVVRKTRPALKKSCWVLVNGLISRYGLPLSDRNKSDLTLSWEKNRFIFTSIDDPEKLKSIEGINYVWAEEATELTQADFLQLGLRCRGKNPNGKNTLIFSFNPVDEQSFLREVTENPPENTEVNHSTYKDNVFLAQDDIDTIETLKEQDATYWAIYGEGKWATPENIIYTNWDIVNEIPPEITDIGYGLDFGWNNPTALIKIGIQGDDVYLHEDIYESHLTNSGLIERMKGVLKIGKNTKIVADSAEPQRIEEIDKAGFNVHPSTKGQDSVRSGIDRCKAVRLHITADSVNLQKEVRGYKWKVDKNGNVLDEPVRFRDHGMDGVRYYIGDRPISGVIESLELASVGSRVFGGSEREMVDGVLEGGIANEMDWNDI
jgi:phage terminase large subunit